MYFLITQTIIVQQELLLSKAIIRQTNNNKFSFKLTNTTPLGGFALRLHFRFELSRFCNQQFGVYEIDFNYYDF